MSIVGGLFKAAGLGTLVDSLEAQGVLRASETSGSLIPQMFIGGGGIENLSKEGLLNGTQVTKALENAESDWFKIPSTEWDKKWGSQNIAYDPVAKMAMLEISDKNVNVQPGVDLNKLPSNEFLGFDEVFKAETLKKAYPGIADIKIGFIDDKSSERLAAYDPSSDSILFNRQNPEWKKGYDPVKTVLHEVQHYVQGKELFTGGESFTGVLQENATFQDSFRTLQSKVSTSPATAIKFVKQNPGLGFTNDNVAEALGSLVAKDGLSPKAALERAFKSKDMAEKFLTRAKKNQEIDDILFLKDTNSAAYNQSVKDYMQVAGETFARQTEQRRGMSATERGLNPAMRAIDTDAINKAYGITTDNLTPSTQATPMPQVANMGQSSIPAPAIPQSSIPGLY